MSKLSIKQLIICLAIVGLILSIPSIIYLFLHGSIDEYNGQNYFFIDDNTQSSTILGTIIFALIIILSFLFYISILKKSDKFKNIKNVLLVVFLVGLMFMICLPNTTTDIFYYMGTGRLLQGYGENPYYVTISDFLQTEMVSDAILEHSGFWSNTVPPYGPVWIIICAIFSFFSFGNNTFLLYIFKFASLGIHIATCYLVFKITGKKKFALMYGLNPFLLLEFLTNVHNDLYLVFFVILGIYFLKKKNNIWLALFSLICSILIKYVTIIFAPFFVLYYLRNKTLEKKIGYSFLYAIITVLVILIVYKIFFYRLSDFILLIDTQQNRVKDSIYLLLIYTGFKQLVKYVNLMMIVIFVYSMFLFIYFGLFKREKFSNYMEDIKKLLYVLIFGVLTNLTSWYLSWFFIVIYWLKPKSIKNILWIQFLYELTYVYFIYVHSDSTIYQIVILPFIFVVMLIRQIVVKIKKEKENMNCKKMKSLS